MVTGFFEGNHGPDARTLGTQSSVHHPGQDSRMRMVTGSCGDNHGRYAQSHGIRSNVYHPCQAILIETDRWYW